MEDGLVRMLAGCLPSLEGSKVTVITHAGGDADAIASAYVMSNILRSRYGVKTSLCIPEGPSSLSKLLLDYLEQDWSQDPDKSGFYILVDVGSIDQLGQLSGRLSLQAEKLLVIDHHVTAPGHYPSGAKLFCSDSYQATSSIVYDLCEHLRYNLSSKEAAALFLGIYYDTARLSVARKDTVKRVISLLKLCPEPAELIPRLEMGIEWSERIARIKGAKRMEAYKAGEWIIALSKLSSFKSSMARLMLTLGAHVAIVVGEEEDGSSSATLRSQLEFYEKTGISLARDLVPAVASEVGGSGGGHAMAAGIRSKCGTEHLMGSFVRILSKLLSSDLQRIEG